MLGTQRAAMASDSVQVLTGGAGADTIRVTSTLAFSWVPDPGNAYSWNLSYYYDNQFSRNGSAPSTATGFVSFQDVAAGQGFTMAATSFAFKTSWGCWRRRESAPFWRA
jgi:hypothetical protein